MLELKEVPTDVLEALKWRGLLLMMVEATAEVGAALDEVAPPPMVCLDDKDLGSRLTALDERCFCCNTLLLLEEDGFGWNTKEVADTDEAVFEVSFSTRGVRMCCLLGRRTFQSFKINWVDTAGYI